MARAPAPDPPPEILSLHIHPGQLVFELSTVSGADYTILGGTSVTSVSNSVDTFTATGPNTIRTVNQAILSQEFFLVRRD